MQVQVHSGEFHVTETMNEHVTSEVTRALSSFGNRVVRVEVHLHDMNGKGKAGMDKRCVMEARLAGINPLAVDHTAETLPLAITQAAGKLERLVRHRLERLEDRKGGAGIAQP